MKKFKEVLRTSVIFLVSGFTFIFHLSSPVKAVQEKPRTVKAAPEKVERKTKRKKEEAGTKKEAKKEAKKEVKKEGKKNKAVSEPPQTGKSEKQNESPQLLQSTQSVAKDPLEQRLRSPAGESVRMTAGFFEELARKSRAVDNSPLMAKPRVRPRTEIANLMSPPKAAPVATKREEKNSVLSVKERMKRFENPNPSETVPLKPEPRRVFPSVRNEKPASQEIRGVEKREEPKLEKKEGPSSVTVVSQEPFLDRLASSSFEKVLDSTEGPSSEAVASKESSPVSSGSNLGSSGKIEDLQAALLVEEKVPSPPPSPSVVSTPSPVRSSSEGIDRNDIQPQLPSRQAEPAATKVSALDSGSTRLLTARRAAHADDSAASSSGSAAASSSYMGSAQSSASSQISPDTIESLQVRIENLKAKISSAQKLVDAGSRQKGLKMHEIAQFLKDLAKAEATRAQLIKEESEKQEEMERRLETQRKTSARITGQAKPGSYLADITSEDPMRRLRKAEIPSSSKEDTSLHALKKGYDRNFKRKSDATPKKRPSATDRDSDDWK